MVKALRPIAVVFLVHCNICEGLRQIPISGHDGVTGIANPTEAHAAHTLTLIFQTWAVQRSLTTPGAYV
jgi:hypothetical protein